MVGQGEYTSTGLDENNTFTETTWPRTIGVLEGKLPNGREVSKCPRSARFYNNATVMGADRDDGWGYLRQLHGTFYAVFFVGRWHQRANVWNS